MNCLFHPLVGLSSIFACGVAANVGLKIQNGSAKFFGKGANPSGVVTAPDIISDEDRDKLVEHWNTQFSGDHAGAVAVLGSNLKFEALRMSSVDAQLIEQLRWTAEQVCSTFHVPPFKIGIGSPPTYANAAESLNLVYYTDCLQSHIESMELALDEGLGIGEGVSLEESKILGVELDLDALIRMDKGAQMAALDTAVRGGILAPNEARKKLDYPPAKGGDSPMMQQQQFSLEALAERDQDKPFSKPTAPPPGTPANGGGETPPPPKPTPEPAKALTPEERALVRQRFVSGVRKKAA